jgi:SH3-like domain-containing protein
VLCKLIKIKKDFSASSAKRETNEKISTDKIQGKHFERSDDLGKASEKRRNKMYKEMRFLLILAVVWIGLSGCAVSDAQKQSVTISPSPTPTVAKAEVKPDLDKKTKAEETPVEMTEEDIKNGSVKSDDYEENMNPDKNKKDFCSVEGFVADTDPNGLNVRREGSSKGQIIGKIPFSKDGTIVHIIASDFNGWLKINRAENMEGEVVFNREGWVSANLLATSTTGYDGSGVKLYEAGKGTKVLSVIPSETVVKIVSCNKDWVRVKYKTLIGWLDAGSQCGNPVTNCS